MNAQVLVNFEVHLVDVFPVNVLITEKQAMPRMITKLGQREKSFCLSGIRLFECALSDKSIDTVEGDAHTRKPIFFIQFFICLLSCRCSFCY